MDDIIETKLNIGDFFEYDNEQFRYFGNVKDTKDLPNYNCCYSIGNILYIRKFEKPLELKIKPTDSLLLAEVKKALKGFSPIQFRNLFNSETEYRNMRRAIEKSNRLSASRFRIIMEKLGVDKSKIIDIFNTYYRNYIYKGTARLVHR
jgi:hypothetical protein